MRQTIKRETLVRTTNGLIEQITKSAIRAQISWDTANAQRQVLCIQLESLLHDADSYKGFRYMGTEFTDSGELRPNYDDYARQYYF